MSIVRGPIPGEQDRRPTMICSGCKRLEACYRGPVLSVVRTERGIFERVAWMCPACFAHVVAIALRP